MKSSFQKISPGSLIIAFGVLAILVELYSPLLVGNSCMDRGRAKFLQYCIYFLIIFMGIKHKRKQI